MSGKEALERKNMLLWKDVQQLIIKQNQEGLSPNDRLLMQHMIKEHYHLNHQLNSK